MNQQLQYKILSARLYKRDVCVNTPKVEDGVVENKASGSYKEGKVVSSLQEQLCRGLSKESEGRCVKEPKLEIRIETHQRK